MAKIELDKYYILSGEIHLILKNVILEYVNGVKVVYVKSALR